MEKHCQVPGPHTACRARGRVKRHGRPRPLGMSAWLLQPTAGGPLLGMTPITACTVSRIQQTHMMMDSQ